MNVNREDGTVNVPVRGMYMQEFPAGKRVTSVTITAVDDDAPTRVNNTGSTVAEGGMGTISNTQLRYDDSEQPATSVTV